jgi:hypothetical protein
MSSCKGELAQTKLNVKAVDQSGTVIMDKPVSTLRSGFMELWLPRNRTINLTGGHEADVTISNPKG